MIAGQAGAPSLVTVYDQNGKGFKGYAMTNNDATQTTFIYRKFEVKDAKSGKWNGVGLIAKVFMPVSIEYHM